jgi:hypothetical protein
MLHYAEAQNSPNYIIALQMCTTMLRCQIKPEKKTDPKEPYTLIRDFFIDNELSVAARLNASFSFAST